MASAGKLNTNNLSDETFDLLCTTCNRKGRTREADKYCLECNDYYCLTCVKVHEDVAYLSGHKILNKEQFTSTHKRHSARQGSGKTLPSAPTERCKRHKHHYIDMYCQTHDDVGCATCMAVDHRSCQDTFYIPEFLQNNASTLTPKKTQHILEGVAKSLTEYDDYLQHQKQNLLKAEAKTLKDIRKFRKEINNRLDQLEQNSVNEIENIYKAFIDEIKKASDVVQTNKHNVGTARDKVLSPGNNVSQDFVNVKKGNQVANMASKCTQDIKAQIQPVDIKFICDQKLAVLLEDMNALGMTRQKDIKREGEMNARGKIRQKAIKNGADSPSPTSTVQYHQGQPCQITKQKNPVTSKVQQTNVLLGGKRKKKYLVELESEKNKCNIVSACVLVDGTIILSDNRNMKLKRLKSTTFAVHDYCDLPENPWQVCPTSKQEVAVCVPEKQVVQFVSDGTRLTKTKRIKTDFDCWGLSYANGILYISDNASVYIYSVSGSLLTQFSEDRSGQELFSDIRSLSVSRDGLKIFISNYHKGLIVLNNNGEVVGNFNAGQHLDGAYDCYLTASESLLVCGRNSHNVLQFASDGEPIGEIVKSDEDDLYQAVCCNYQMSKLILGSYSDNYIDVYDLV